MKLLLFFLGGEILVFGNVEKRMKVDCLMIINLVRFFKMVFKSCEIKFKK